MNDLLNKISEEAKRIKLSEVEKSQLRNNLVNFIENNPVRIRGDWRLNSVKAVKSPLNHNWFSLFNNYKFMPVALIALLFVGGGVSFASQGSLPGDLLYPVKVNINEKIEQAFTLTSDGSANLQVRLAERRLEEAEKLALTGKLDEDTRLEVEERFDKHASSADKKIIAIAETEPEVALSIVSRFETSLRTYEAILTQLDKKEDQNTTEEGTVVATLAMKAEVAELPKDGLLDIVRVHAEQTEGTRINLESKFDDDGFSPKTDNEQSASGMMKSAINVRAEVSKFIEAKIPDLNNEIRIKAEAQMKFSDDAFEIGKTQLELKNYNQAFVSFQKSIRLAQEAKSIVIASQGWQKDWKQVNPSVSILPIDLPDTKPENPIEKPILVPTPKPKPGISEELGNYFASKIEAELSTLGYIFIEGPTPGFLMEHFVVLDVADFNGVQAFGGTYYVEYVQGKSFPPPPVSKILVFKKTETDVVSSNDKAISRKGYLTLLVNSSTRLNVKITDKSSVDSFVRLLSGNKILLENPLIELR